MMLVSLSGHQEIFPPVDVTVLPAEELRHWSGGELCLTDVAEVPGEVYGLPLHQAGQQGHVTRLPPPGWQRQTESVQLVSQLLPAVLRLGPELDCGKKY